MGDTRCKKFSSLSRTVAGLVGGSWLLVAAVTAHAASSDKLSKRLPNHHDIRVEQLSPNTPLERTLAGGESHLYDISHRSNVSMFFFRRSAESPSRALRISALRRLLMERICCSSELSHHRTV